MITIKQIEDLMKITSDRYTISSFYIGIQPQFLVQKKYKILVKDLIKQRTKNHTRYNEEQKEFIDKDIERILQFMNYEFDEKSRGLAIFASSPLNLWQVYPLPRRIKGRFVIDYDPYTRPLVRFFDENEKYFTVLVDSKKARLFSMYAGILNERKEVYDEVQGRHKKGGWSQARFQRHIKDQVAKHLQNVSSVVYDLYKKEKFDHCILGGQIVARNNFKNILHSSIQKIIVGEIDVALDDSQVEIMDSVQHIVEKFEDRQSKRYLKILRDRLGKKHLAVSGLEKTVKMLQQARIHTVIIKEDLIIPGFKCVKCETPFTKDAKKCSLCSKKIVRVPDIVDEIIEKTWELNGEAKFIKTSKELDNLGGIAALLRW